MSIFATSKSMDKRNVCASCICLMLSALIFIAPSQVFASKGGELSDKTRVVTLRVDNLGIIKNRKISSYSLAAVSGGRMSAIPYQFDERTESGYVYMKDLKDKLKAKDPILGKVAFFDADDELIFMFRDAGPRKKNGMSTDGKIISEIEVRGYDGTRQYVYLVEGSRSESENYYVRYSSALGRVETDYYALKVNPKNAFMWEEFYYENFDGAHPRKPIDTIKLRMKSNAFGGVPITVNNKHLVAKAIAEKTGPIRATTQYKLMLTYFKTPLLAMKLQIVHHEQEIRYDAQTQIPKVRRRLISKPSLMVSVDGYDLQGASVRASGGPLKDAIVDGAVSDIEQQLNKAPIENEDDNWWWLDTHYGFMMLVDFRIEADEDVPMALMYEDNADKKVKPEYYQGQLPNAGFEVTRIPLKGSMRVVANIHMFDEELDIDPGEFATYVTTEPIIKSLNL